jgi:hypothetical protein
MHQKPIRIPSRSHSAKLLLRRPCQAGTAFCFSFTRALCLARAQRKEAMGDRKSRSIRLSFFCNQVHFPACESPSPPAASTEITNKAACWRVTNFIRAFIFRNLSIFLAQIPCIATPAPHHGRKDSFANHRFPLRQIPHLLAHRLRRDQCHFEAESTPVVLPLAWRPRAEGRKACCCRSSRAKASWASRTGLARD